MALEDKDIFNAIFNKYSDQPIEFIMEQYEKAKILRGCPACFLILKGVVISSHETNRFS